MRMSYKFVLQWGDKTNDLTFVGNSEHEILKEAAKHWFPNMVKTQLNEAIRLMRSTGAVILRRRVRV